MILVVALNPALDVTHHVAGVDWAGTNRPAMVRTRPGGKGLNVARTLRALGVAVAVTGLAGGAAGEEVAAGLAAAGVAAAFTPIGGQTRRTFAVVDTERNDAALFNEPGPVVEPVEYSAFRERYEKELARSGAVVLSGSLPPGLGPGTYAELTARAAAAGVPVVLDAHGEALARGAAAGPAIVKPNLAELAGLAGRQLSAGGRADHEAVAAAAAKLRAVGAQAVVVSLGAEGLWAVTPEGRWHAAPPGPVAGNPIGAGDAVAAGLARGLVAGWPWEERLRHAVALGTAVAAAPVAGEFSRTDYEALLGAVTVGAR
ncbi:MAG: hexose kinase [Nocardiopsaceae bacterium]|jgi:tagatose 6-phosphate kinase|nr:hexose kinase [Nocardiopsaceae bacterium]